MRSKLRFSTLTATALLCTGMLSLAFLSACGAGSAATPTHVSDIATVTANSQWKPQIKTFDGVEMVLVPPGCFMMGTNSQGGKQCFDQPLWIDKTEVTNVQFTGLGGKAARVPNSKEDNHPRESISLPEARDYCAKRGARLPTEAEWEYAARGPDGLVYPWGNEFVADNTVYGGYSGGQSVDVGSKPGGASWVGALDLSGNVWEWTSSLDKPFPYNAADGREGEGDASSLHVMRGGSCNYTEDRVQTTSRSLVPLAAGGAFDVGFRCVRSY